MYIVPLQPTKFMTQDSRDRLIQNQNSLDRLYIRYYSLIVKCYQNKYHLKEIKVTML